MRYIQHTDIVHSQSSSTDPSKISVVLINDKKKFDQYSTILDQYDDDFMEEHDKLIPSEVKPYIDLDDTTSIETDRDRYNRILKGAHDYYVILVEGDVAGMIVVQLMRKANTIYLSTLYIRQEYRRAGVAQIAMNAVFDIYKKKKYKVCLLHTLSQNDAVKLYKKMDFETWGLDMYRQL
ncbi:MAG: GNAT family N-acetyltransferase [Alphaproteobacteria bacterium]|nr:GNAT family N-acetyltransferase [Alphaproteobacteria bacterium]